MRKVDVLVVGSGPGGSSAAKTCVDGGLKTLLIERRKLPRRKACSGIIDNISQNYVYENFGPIPESAFSRPNICRGMAFYFPSVGTILDDAQTYMLYVWRDRFDHFLAKTSKAKLEDETNFLHLEQKSDGVEAIVERKGKQLKIKAKYLIGADGGHSRVIKSFAPEVYENLPFAFACQKYYEGEINADDRHLYWFLAPNMGPFPWLNFKDEQIIIGLAMMKGDKFQPKFDNLINLLKRDFGLKIKRELAVEACHANTMTPLNRQFPGRGRVLMVGDAMGLMHQGHASISAALVSGGNAGEAVIEAVNNGTDALRRYKELVRPEMERCLDQFNPMRMRATSASTFDRSKGGFFAGLSMLEKAKAARDALVFFRSDFNSVEGMPSTMLKNIAHRAIFGRYNIPSVD